MSSTKEDEKTAEDGKKRKHDGNSASKLQKAKRFT